MRRLILASKYLFFTLLFVGGFNLFSFGQGTETFQNICTSSCSPSSSSYGSRSWTGDDGSTWTATNSRTDQTINGAAMTMNDDKANTYIESGSIAGGVQDLTITTQRKYSGNSGNIDVLINGTNVGTVPYSASVTTTTISGINVSGNIVIKIVNDIGGSNGGGDDRVAIDDVTWTTYSAVAAPEIQTQIPTGTDVACGYTYDFGTQTTGSNTNQTITIKNIGTADLNITDYPLSGTNASEFSLSPASTSTTIVAGSSYDITVTFSPTTTGSKTAKITINNDDSDEGACEINFTAIAQDPCTAPANQPTSLVLSNITTSSIDGSFTAASPVADNYLIVYSTSNTLSSNPVDGTTYSPGDNIGGGTVVDNISGTTFTASGLTPGTEYYFFIFANNNVSCTGGPKYNTSSPLTGDEITIPENANWTAPGCISNSTITLNWNAAPGNSTGYLLVVRQDNTPHAITSLDPTTNLGESTDYSAAAQFGSTTEYSRILYKGTATTVLITNLPTANCTFKIYTYTIGANGTDYKYSSGTQQTNTIGLHNVISASSTCGDSQSSISWSNPTASCFDEILVVTNETSGIGFSPSGDGSAYTANTVYAAPDQVVYKGTGTNVTVTGLTNGTTYYFEIFVRKGTEWSSGVEVSCTPNVSTTLYPGDLAIVAVNTNGTTGDEMSFFAFKDITNGTIIQVTDNGYERATAGLWGDSEGFINLERIGNTIPAGTVITLIMTGVNGKVSADFDMLICGINDDANWNIYSSGSGTGFNFNPTDQIWMMQDGNWTDPSGSQNATYDGYVLYGWTAIGWESSPGYNSTSGSTLFPGTECFNTNVAVDTNKDKVKFFTDTSITRSQSGWIGEINSSGNWTGYADNPSYDAGGLDYSGSCIKFKIDNSLGNGAGMWHGSEDNNWFNCANWLNMKVPDETVDVTILANAKNEANIDDTQPDANTYGPIAKCKNLTIQDGGDTVYVQIDDANDQLQVKQVLTIESKGKLYNDNGGTLSVDGNIIINDTALLDMHANPTSGSTLNLKGNWIDNNIINDATHGFYEDSSKIVFLGTSTQTISDATGNETFYNAQINNSSGVDLNSTDITISNSLTLTNGLINTGSNKVDISTSNVSAVTGQNTNSYVNGNLRRAFASNTNTYAFPVGTSTRYTLAEVVNNNLVGINYIDSKFLSSFTSTGSLDPAKAVDFGTPYVDISPEGIWYLEPDAQPTSGNYSIKLHFDDGGGANAFTGLADNKFGPLKRPVSSTSASDWTALNGTLNANGGTGRMLADGFAQRNNITSFSHFAIGRSEFPLPIELIDFKAKIQNHTVKLEWTTAAEINNDFFTIERSADAINFVAIQTIQGAGNSMQAIHYEAFDFSPLSGESYYRLRQTDFDGKSTVSKMVPVNFSNGNNTINFNIINNFLSVNSAQGNPISVSIYDVTGKLLIQKASKEGSLKISLSTLTSQQLYFLTIHSADKVETGKFIKL